MTRAVSATSATRSPGRRNAAARPGTPCWRFTLHCRVAAYRSPAQRMPGDDRPRTSSVCWATTFCMEEIGVSMPPKLHAKASPSSNVFANLCANNGRDRAFRGL